MIAGFIPTVAESKAEAAAVRDPTNAPVPTGARRIVNAAFKGRSR